MAGDPHNTRRHVAWLAGRHWLTALHFLACLLQQHGHAEGDSGRARPHPGAVGGSAGLTSSHALLAARDMPLPGGSSRACGAALLTRLPATSAGSATPLPAAHRRLWEAGQEAGTQPVVGVVGAGHMRVRITAWPVHTICAAR